ncbi:hypothetical protein BDZ97DRAFT_1825821, partial [Flammula alnicola]
MALLPSELLAVHPVLILRRLLSLLLHVCLMNPRFIHSAGSRRRQQKSYTSNSCRTGNLYVLDRLRNDCRHQIRLHRNLYARPGSIHVSVNTFHRLRLSRASNTEIGAFETDMLI